MPDTSPQTHAGTAPAKSPNLTFSAYVPETHKTGIIEQHFRNKDRTVTYAARGHLEAIFEKIEYGDCKPMDLINLLGKPALTIFNRYSELSVVVLDDPDYRKYGTYFPLLHLRYGHPSKMRTAKYFDRLCVVLTLGPEK